MNIKKLNEELSKIINESEEKTFADWYGEDLTGQTYEGSINCSDQGITSLKGAPAKVTGDFICISNDLATLEGAPKEVGRDFWCGSKNLTSLKGGPKKVAGSFHCEFSNLTTLEGAPQKVGGDFNCYMSGLTSLEGAPKYVGGDFDCDDNNLTTLEGAPKYVVGDFSCDDNNLRSRKGKPKKPGGSREGYTWVIPDLELDANGIFDTPQEAYEDAKDALENDFNAEVGAFEPEYDRFYVYDPGDSREGWESYEGYGYIEEVVE